MVRADFLVSLTVGVPQESWDLVWKELNDCVSRISGLTTTINLNSQDLTMEEDDQEENLAKLAVLLRENGHAEKEIFGVITTIKQSDQSLSLYER